MSGCSVFLSIHFDAEAHDLKSTSEDRLYGRFSYGRYGVRAGLPRLAAMLERRGIKATVFVAASDAKRHPDAIRALRDAGLLDDAGLKALNDEVLAEVDDAVKFAEESPDPAPEELWTDVYAPEAG